MQFKMNREMEKKKLLDSLFEFDSWWTEIRKFSQKKIWTNTNHTCKRQEEELNENQGFKDESDKIKKAS